MVFESDAAIVLVEPSRALLDHARSMVRSVVVVDSAAHFRWLDGLTHDILGATLCDWSALEPSRLAAMARSLAGEIPIVGCLSQSEGALICVAQLAQELGVEANSVETVRAVCDKSLMRQRLNRVAGHVVEWILADCLSVAVEFSEQIGFPVVCKPVDGAGSIGVRVIGEAEQLRDLTFPVLVEEYLEGTEFSVEAITQHGHHQIVGVTRKRLGRAGSPTALVEFGHTFPAAIDDTIGATVVSATVEALDLLGITTGLTHTELVVGSAKARIVETHNRHGGQHIADIVKLASGYDMQRQAVRCAIGLGVDKPTPPQRFAGVRSLDVPRGWVSGVVGVERARYLPGVVDIVLHRGPGDYFSGTYSTGTQIGDVIATGATEAELEAVLDEVENTIRVDLVGR